MVRGTIDLIDNTKMGNFKNKYGTRPHKLAYNFLAYLKQVKHKKLYMFAKEKPIRMEMSWRTKNNGHDCAVFTMRRMETYYGGGVDNWKCALVDESEEQTEQLIALRATYLNVIIRSPLNAKRAKVSNRVEQWWTIKDQLEFGIENEEQIATV
ncbi:hypothetical protein QQ045_008159 [Rhodiola kirilowii]